MPNATEIGLIIGGCCLVFIIGIILIFVCLRKNKNKEEIHLQDNSDATKKEPTTLGHRQKHSANESNRVMIKPSDINLEASVDVKNIIDLKQRYTQEMCELKHIKEVISSKEYITKVNELYQQKNQEIEVEEINNKWLGKAYAKAESKEKRQFLIDEFKYQYSEKSEQQEDQAIEEAISKNLENEMHADSHREKHGNQALHKKFNNSGIQIVANSASINKVSTCVENELKVENLNFVVENERPEASKKNNVFRNILAHHDDQFNFNIYSEDSNREIEKLDTFKPIEKKHPNYNRKISDTDNKVRHIQSEIMAKSVEKSMHNQVDRRVIEQSILRDVIKDKVNTTNSEDSEKN